MSTHHVWILWGCEWDRDRVTHYEFATLEELNAFLLGVSEADGWLNYEQFDTAAEMAEAFAAEEAAS